jgi:low temperature requirement protein LtrA
MSILCPFLGCKALLWTYWIQKQNSFTHNQETEISPETLVIIYPWTLHHVPEYLIFIITVVRIQNFLHNVLL